MSAGGGSPPMIRIADLIAMEVGREGEVKGVGLSEKSEGYVCGQILNAAILGRSQLVDRQLGDGQPVSQPMLLMI